MVDITLAQDAAEADAALDLAERVWGVRPISAPVLRALELAGLYLSLARDENGTIVGMCAGFVGMHADGPHLHSHLAAVAPDRRGSGIGRALKRHQRDWCLHHGIDTVTWTFDPLVVENARFNLHHLGATGDRYLVDLYGPMDDDINRGDPSDRLLVRWELSSARTLEALGRPHPTPGGDAARAAGATDLVTVDPDAGPAVTLDAATQDRDWLVATPSDVVAIRRADPALAGRWRRAVRDAMRAAFDADRQPMTVTDDGCYLFTARSERT